MKNNSFLLMFFFTIPFYSQTYISKKQSYYEAELSNETYVEKERKVIIDDNTFIIEMIDDSTFKGIYKVVYNTLDDGTKEEIYKIKGGGLIQITDDQVWINLYATHYNQAYSYYLENHIEPTEVEKLKASEEVDKRVAEEAYKSHVKLYGQLEADCIRDKKIRIGMRSFVIALVLGQPNSINVTENKQGISKQFVYDSQYVYSENGIITSIQTEL